MDWSWRVAIRYLFARKGNNFITIITRISVFGLALGTAALILVMSVMNGLQGLIAGLINTYNPELIIEPVVGKYIDLDAFPLHLISDHLAIEASAYSIEETAMFGYDGENAFGTLKGVSTDYAKVNNLDSVLVDGTFVLEEADAFYAVIGSGLARTLYVDLYNPHDQLTVFMIDRDARSNAANPIQKNFIRPGGVFSVQQDIDNELVIVPLEFAQSLLEKQNEVSAIELKLKSSFSDNIADVQKDLQSSIGGEYDVKNRFEQDAATLKIMNIEKWIAFAVTGLMLLLVAFNLVGSLWMMVLDKKEDIYSFHAMGAREQDVRNIFRRLGLSITSLSVIIGISLAMLIYVLQKTVGLIRMGEGLIVDSYPIEVEILDLFVVGIFVVFIGYLAAIPAARRASRLVQMPKK